MKKIFLFTTISLLFFSSYLISEEIFNCNIVAGIDFTQKIETEKPLITNLIKINFKKANVYLQTALAGSDSIFISNQYKGRGNLRDLVKRKDALAAINADYFPFTGDPLNLMIQDSELISESMPNRAAMAITVDQKVYFDTFTTNLFLAINDGNNLIIDGINRSAKKNEIIILTPRFGELSFLKRKYLYILISNVNLPIQIGKIIRGTVTNLFEENILPRVPTQSMMILVGEAQIPLFKEKCKIGDQIIFTSELKASNIDFDTTKIAQAVGGGPWLVKNSQKYIDYEIEGFKRNEFVNRRHPRTAVGINKEGEFCLITVDGRSSISRGASLSELADILLKLNIENAINLDGGGSTSMVIKDVYVNAPSDGFPREIANAILVYAADEAESDPSQLAMKDNNKDAVITMPETELKEKSRVALILPKDAESEQGFLWGTLEGKCFVNQKGELISIGFFRGNAAAISKMNKKYFFPFKTVR